VYDTKEFNARFDGIEHQNKSVGRCRYQASIPGGYGEWFKTISDEKLKPREDEHQNVENGDGVSFILNCQELDVGPLFDIGHKHGSCTDWPACELDDYTINNPPICMNDCKRAYTNPSLPQLADYGARSFEDKVNERTSQDEELGLVDVT
jgi:hypothetical protein